MFARTITFLSIVMLSTSFALAQSEPGIPGLARLERAVDSRRVVPIIRSQRDIDALPADARQGLAKRPLSDELYVILAEDTGTAIRYLTNEQVSKLGWLAQEEKVNALINLVSLLPRFEIRDSGGMFMILAGGNYEASMLLATPLWKTLLSKLKGEPVVGIPNRDLFFVTGSQDKENLAELRKTVNDAYTTGNFPISRELFLIGQKGITNFKDAP